MPSSKDPLLKASDILGKLYDEESMMSIEKSVADGFVVLLGGGQANGDVSLAFLALTQGNVLDACFGVVNPTRRDDTPAYRAARDGKFLLDECATTDEFQRTAVEAYFEAFQVVSDYRSKMSKLNCITRCFREKKIRKKAQKKLVAAFTDLGRAIGESR